MSLTWHKTAEISNSNGDKVEFDLYKDMVEITISNSNEESIKIFELNNKDIGILIDLLSGNI